MTWHDETKYLCSKISRIWSIYIWSRRYTCGRLGRRDSEVDITLGPKTVNNYSSRCGRRSHSLNSLGPNSESVNMAPSRFRVAPYIHYRILMTRRLRIILHLYSQIWIIFNSDTMIFSFGLQFVMKNMIVTF